MYQRLLLALSVFFISGAVMAQNVMNPADPVYQYDPSAAAGSVTNPTVTPGLIQRWIHDETQRPGEITFDQSKFKCYYYNGVAFRLRFPNNYDPTKKYPLIMFLHGGGEAANYPLDQPHNVNPAGGVINRDNQTHLLLGARLFEQRIDSGLWNGFMLFPQLFKPAQWDDNNFPFLNHILDALQQYNGLDPDRVIAIGLSAGGFGVVNYAYYYPDRIASVVSASAQQIETMGNSASVAPFIHIPVWIATGGTDNLPNPSNVFLFRDAMAKSGGDIYESYYPSTGHGAWTAQWKTTDPYNRFILTQYWNSAHKAQPLVYSQNTEFCAGQAISAKMGITSGTRTYVKVGNNEIFTEHPFYAFEWQYDGGSGFTTIPGATSNTYTATQAGRYRVRFKRTSTSAFSDWSPNPIVISTKTCAPVTDTAFVEHFESTPINDYTAISGGPNFENSDYRNNYVPCQNGLFVNATESITHDATGRQGGRFMLNNTSNEAGCKYYAGDMVWSNKSVITGLTQNTNYTLSFYVGNQSLGPAFPSNPPFAKISAMINFNTAALTPSGGVAAILQGDISWKKYSYTWNSGSNTTAQIILRNNTFDPNGNDFVIDEISLVKSKPLPMPGYAFTNVNLWAKANTLLPAPDSSQLSKWENSNINGNALSQSDTAIQPIFKNNAVDNINFNPTVVLAVAGHKQITVPGGFTGSTVHNSVYAFMVNKPVPVNGNWLREAVSEGSISVYSYDGGYVQWNAGDGPNNLFTGANIIDANKPTVWSFSKNNSFGTGSGNKQDIRKNGIVVASNSNTSTLTGINDNFSLGSLDGSIAEVIYLLDSNITAKTQNRIESYLALKYGTTLGTTAAPISYTASDSITVFWPANAAYQNDVFGIGKDSLSALLQIRSNSANSGSGDGTGQSGKGNLVVSTSAQLMDKQFLMIGNNAGSLAQHPIVSGEAPNSIIGSYRVDRKWKVYNTGTPAVGAVSISFDTTGLQNQQGGAIVANYALMIDQDGDGNFNTGSLTFYTATSASGKKINFASAPLGNGVVFTLITLKSAALPAVWLGFTAEAVNGNAVLNWKTSDEINVDRYTVEHSFNGVSFSPVGSVTANNSTGVNQYTLTDNNLAAGIHYYRIRRTDKDGKVEYSDIKSVKITSNGANVVVRPNPVTTNVLALSVSVQQSTKTLVQVMSVDGKVLVQRNIGLASGMNTVNLDISNVPSGIYLVQVQLNDGLVTKKFIKQP